MQTFATARQALVRRPPASRFLVPALIAASVLVAFMSLSAAAAEPADQSGITTQIVKPEQAKALFDGKDVSQWLVWGSNEAADWPVQDGAMVTANNHDIATKEKFKDFQLHIEFNEPQLGPEFKGQDRGNSGVYLQGRYEIQVLDSFNNETYADGGCAAVYGVNPPLVNAAKPPGEWQTYDINFRTARYQDGKKVEDARVTIYWNGQLVQNNTLIPHPTGGGARESDEGGPIRLQFHHHAVRFRNVWIVPLKEEHEKK